MLKWELKWDLQLKCKLKLKNNIDGINLIIKPHPNEVDRLASELVDNCQLDNAYIADDINILYDLIHCADLVVTTFSSTSSIEAVLFNKPVLILNFTDSENPIGTAREGVAVETTTPDKVEEEIRTLLYDDDKRMKIINKHQKFISKYAYRIDGKSTSRVVKLIKNSLYSYGR